MNTGQWFGFVMLLIPIGTIFAIIIVGSTGTPAKDTDRAIITITVLIVMAAVGFALLKLGSTP